MDGGNPLIPFIIVMVIIFFFMIRPQMKKEKERQKMLAGLKKNDYVVTTGGIYGTITNIKNNIIELKVDEQTKLQIAKSAIIQVVDKEKLEKTEITELTK